MLKDYHQSPASIWTNFSKVGGDAERWWELVGEWEGGEEEEMGGMRATERGRVRLNDEVEDADESELLLAAQCINIPLL